MRTSRRIFVAAALGAAALSAFAQRANKLPVLAYVFGTARSAEMAGPDPVHPHARVFVHRLRELGWEDGRNIVIERHGAENSRERARAIFADLVARKVDVICATATVEGTLLSLEALQATRTIPVVFAGGSDSVAQGLVASLAKPGGNATGVATTISPEFVTKRLELLMEIAPRVKRVAYLGPKTDPQFLLLRDAAKRLGLTLILAEVERADQLDEAFAALKRERVDALLVSSFGVDRSHPAQIAAFAAQRRLPTGFSYYESVEAGGLMSYGVNILDINRRAADYVNRVLRGAKPADLPVELPSKFELALNLKTARALGLKIPQSVLLRADRVIE